MHPKIHLAETPRILGFEGLRDFRDGSIHLGWKMNERSDERERQPNRNIQCQYQL